MATAQYIGARYVPVLADPFEWSSEKTYEPLTIVMHEGNSYTSRQFVPKGIDITNETYWALTGNYNAQIDQYRQDVAHIRSIIPADAFSSVDTVKGYIDSALDSIDAEITNQITEGFHNRDAFVTPEMFGAKGDGITDDTQAWQLAVNSGKNVIAANKIYLCSEIRVTKNITIDCAGCEFICTGNTLFNIEGSVTATLYAQYPYARNQFDYQIASAAYRNYTGFAMLRGDNNFEPSRTYYVGGFVCTFNNGYMSNRYPIPVNNTNIDLIDPITVTLKNISEITFNSAPTRDRNIIKITYGKNCVIKNIKLTSDGYNGILLQSCLNCTVDNINYSRESVFTGDNYLIDIADSSYCTVQNCYLFNKNWHCVTTGGTYLCYCNRVINSVLLNESGLAYDDHENALGTTLQNSIIASCYVTGMCFIDNVIILQEKVGTTNNCLIRVSPCGIKENATYTIRNVTFAATTISPAYFGIWFTKSYQETGHTYYLTNVSIDNVKNINSEVAECTIRLNSGNADYTTVYGEVSINNTNLWTYTLSGASLQYTDIDNFILTVSNCNNAVIGYNQSYNCNILKISNCTVRLGAGNCKELHVDNSTINPSSACTITDLFMGTNLKGRISSGAIANTTKVIVNGYAADNNDMSILGIVKTPNGTPYYVYIADDGTLTTARL